MIAAAVLLCLGTTLLLWCAPWASRALIIYTALFMIGSHLRVGAAVGRTGGYVAEIDSCPRSFSQPLLLGC